MWFVLEVPTNPKLVTFAGHDQVKTSFICKSEVSRLNQEDRDQRRISGISPLDCELLVDSLTRTNWSKVPGVAVVLLA